MMCKGEREKESRVAQYRFLQCCNCGSRHKMATKEGMGFCVAAKFMYSIYRATRNLLLSRSSMYQCLLKFFCYSHLVTLEWMPPRAGNPFSQCHLDISTLSLLTIQYWMINPYGDSKSRGSEGHWTKYRFFSRYFLGVPWLPGTWYPVLLMTGAIDVLYAFQLADVHLILQYQADSRSRNTRSYCGRIMKNVSRVLRTILSMYVNV